MINLAGADDCDDFIRGELTQAGIACLNTKDVRSEVPYTVFGILGHAPFSESDTGYFERHTTTPEIAKRFAPFVFTRAWVYWCVSGYVPLEVANEMYFSEDYYHRSTSKNDYGIRANGHCANPPPIEQVQKYLVCGKQVVNSYHIDKQQGLNFFVETLKKYKII